LFTPTLKGVKSKCYDWALVSDEYLLRRQVFFHPLGPGEEKNKEKNKEKQSILFTPTLKGAKSKCYDCEFV
jgi:hypothetical protein